MRTIAVIALLTGMLGLGAAFPADAADLPRVSAGEVAAPPSVPVRAGMLVLADNQPGVVVRSYWRAPWRHRHFYPATGRRPAVGRREHLPPAGKRLRPAQSFERHWWVSSTFIAPRPDIARRRIEREPSLK
jgi:hypothetical protein